MPSSKFGFLLGFGVEDRHDRRRDAAMQPRHRHAVCIEPGFEVLDRYRVEVVVMQIVFARPDDLDRLAVHRLRQHGRLDAEIGLRLASEPAAEQRDVHGDVVDLHAEPLRDHVARGLR